MPGEQDLAARHAEVRRDDAADPDLFSERALDGVRKRLPGAGEGPQRAGEDPLEFQHAAFVENDRVEILRIEPGVGQAPFNRRRWKGGVVLAPRQALFLYGTDRHAIDDERGRRIVVVRGYPEDLHLNTGSLADARPLV